MLRQTDSLHVLHVPIPHGLELGSRHITHIHPLHVHARHSVAVHLLLEYGLSLLLHQLLLLNLRHHLGIHLVILSYYEGRAHASVSQDEHLLHT